MGRGDAAGPDADGREHPHGAPGFGHQQATGHPVPLLHAALEERIQAPRRDPGEVERRGTEAPNVADLREHAHQRLGLATPLVGGVVEPRPDERLGECRRRGHRSRRPPSHAPPSRSATKTSPVRGCETTAATGPSASHTAMLTAQLGMPHR